MAFYLYRGFGIQRQTWVFSSFDEALLLAESLNRHEPDRLWIEESNGQIRWMNEAQRLLNLDKRVTAHLMGIGEADGPTNSPPADRKTIISIECADARSVQSKRPENQQFSVWESLHEQGYKSIIQTSIKTGSEIGRLLEVQELVLIGDITAVQYIESVTPYRWSRQGLEGGPLPVGVGIWLPPAAPTQRTQ